MRVELRKVLVAIIVSCIGILTACGGNGNSKPTPTPAQLTLSPPALSYSAIVGDAPYTVSVIATKGAPVASDTFAVASSNTAVATVTLNGTTAIISPVGAGTANITFTTGSGITRTIAANVAGDQTQLTLSPAALTYSAIAGSAPYIVTVTSTKKDGVTAGPFTVSSSNTAVATISVNGNAVTITPVAAGSSNIVFTSGSNASVKQTIVATIAPDKTDITLSPSALTCTAVAGGPPYNVTVTAVKNDGVTPDTFTVASSNSAVATVSVTGNVATITPVSAGTANIVFTSGSKSSVKRTIAATITAPTNSPSLTLSPSALAFTAPAGSTPYSVTVTAIKNDGVSTDTFIAVSDTPSVATTSVSGSVVSITPVAQGTANITIATGDGLSKTIVATITQNQGSLTLTPSSLTYTAVAGSAAYQVTVSATKADGVTADTFTVASSNTAAVTAVASGNNVTITPVAVGTANITFTSGAGITKTIAATITAPSISGCDGTEWFCDDFQGETVGNSTVANWDLTKFGSNAAFTVVNDPIVPANVELQYYAGTNSAEIVAPGQVIALVKDAVWNTNVKPHLTGATDDYYFEARIKVQNNSKQGNKELYMIGRYQDANNWYFSGPNLQSTSRVDVGYMKAGTISQVSKTNINLVQGTQGGNDGQWYNVHYEMVGGVQTLFVDGVQMGASVNDTAFTSGKVGLFTFNKSFLIDDIKIGAVQLVLTPNAPTYSAAAGSAPSTVNVTAVKPDGVTPDTFTVSSSNTSVVTVSAAGNVVTISPVGMGTANIVFTSGSNSKFTRTIAANISAPVVTVNPTLTISPAATTYTAVAGSTPYNVTVTAIKNDGVTADTFTVASSNPAAATATASGNVVTITPVAAGASNIVFTSGSGVTVTIAATITANLSQITLSPSSLTYSAAAGSTPYTVTVTAVKSDGVTADTFTVASSNPAAATATASGNVVTITPVAAGNTNIVITGSSGATKTIAATITPNLAAITLSPSALSFTAIAGSTPYTVAVTAVKPDGVTADTFTVSSSNTAVATVAKSGNVVTVTPVAVGTANIVITSGFGITTTIVANISTNLAAITLSPANTTYSAPVGSTPYTVTVTAVKADGTTSDTFTVASSNTAVATASASGNAVTITPVAPGTADIVFTSGSGITSTISATITSLAQITLSPANLTYAGEIGATPYSTSVTAVQADGVTPDTFTAVSSDTTIATVLTTSSSVTITPVSPGTANIVITSGAGMTKTIAATISYSGCDGTEWFCDDFQSQAADNWDIYANPTANTGSLTVVPDVNVPGNYVLQYTAGSVVGNVIALLKDSVWTTAMASHTGDYYVEARIKPQTNGTTSNKQIYLMARYQNAPSGQLPTYSPGWNYGGLNMQTAVTSTAVEAGVATCGTAPCAPPAFNRLFQTKEPMVMGTQGGTGGTDGTWYTVRYEVIGKTGTVYLNGAKVNYKDDTNNTWTSGKIGLFTANKSFLIDDVRVGDPTIKPVPVPQLSITPNVKTYTAEAGDAPYTITVTATKSNLTADTFTVASSDPTVVSVSANMTTNVVTVTPVGPGTANIVFASGSNPGLTITVAATIAPKFVQPTVNYGALTGQTIPAPGASAAYIDDRLVLTFDSVPTIGTSGSVRIFKSSDDSLVDIIPLTGATDSIGLGYAPQFRGVSTNPIWVSGNSVVIAPHLSKMAYNTGYYVAIANGAVNGTLLGQQFVGIGKNGGWAFTTQPAPATGLTTLTVNASGTPADFRTVQGALDYVMKSAPVTPVTINVMDGVYNELLFLRGVNNVTINGQSEAGTIIQYNNYDTLNTGSGSSATGTPTSGGGRAVFLVENSDLLALKNLTLKNTHIRTNLNGTSNQAETIYFNSPTGRLIAENAEFDSEQDTLQLNGYSWFYNTVVAGNVDFIWGGAHVALFENSEIRTVGDSYYGTTPSGGYLMQARVTPQTDKGFIFLNSKLTYGTGPAGNTVATGPDAFTYLARSAGNGTYDNIAYINCKMDTHVAPVGWAANIAGNPTPNPSTATATSGWRESGSMDINGNPLDVSARSATSYQMTSSDITNYGYDTRANIFSSIGWTPVP